MAKFVANIQLYMFPYYLPVFLSIIFLVIFLPTRGVYFLILTTYVHVEGVMLSMVSWVARLDRLDWVVTLCRLG